MDVKKVVSFVFSLCFILIILFSASGCGHKATDRPGTVVIGIPADIENFNPLYSFSVDEGSISELLFLSLVRHKWDSLKCEITAVPMLARSWKWNQDSSSILIELRNDVYWSDGKQFTADDVVFSFDLYSDPAVESRMLGSFTDFYTDENNHILTDKTFRVISPFRLRINFRPGSTPDLYDIDLPLLPKHVFSGAERKTLFTGKEIFSRVTNGPFFLKDWQRNISLTLSANPKSFLYNGTGVKEIVFKVIPDYKSRIMRLMNGELDLVENIKSEDAERLAKEGKIVIASVKGREYDYLGWNNIEPDIYAKNKKQLAHHLFGDPLVRRALTYAINRQEILDEFLYGYGELCSGPISPILKNVRNINSSQYNYDPGKARQILLSSGWRDSDADGILEKGGQKFSFTLSIPAGNPRRAFAAEVVKSNLKAVGIDVKVENLELGYLIEKLYAKELDAWMAGLYIPLPPDLKSCWYSDIENSAMNFPSYRSPAADSIIVSLERTRSARLKNELYSRFQRQIHSDQPVTFLYWIDNIVALSSRLKNTSIDPLGVVHECQLWRVE